MNHKLKTINPKGICQRIIATFNSSANCREALTDLVTDFPTIQPRICCKLINRSRNSKILEIIPHIPWLDLAITFHIPLAVKDGTGLSITVDNALMEQWGLADIGQLYAVARSNTQRLFPSSIKDVVEDNSSWADRQEQIYMVTNEQRLNGACVVLYDGLLRSLSARLGSNFFMVAPSTHEIMVVLDEGGAAERLAEIIKGINREAVMKENRMLSDSVYYYDRDADSVRIW